MSNAGEAWKVCYERNQISWCDPEKISREEIERLAQSEWLQRLIRMSGLVTEKKTAKILEAGCGLGLYALSLGALGYDVTAFDYNQEAIDLADGILKRVQGKDKDLNVHFYRDNLLEIHNADNRYDVVFNQAVLEYFCDQDEKEKAISEMVRVASPGGKVAIIVQHTAHPFHQLWKKMGWPGYIDQPSVAHWSPKGMRDTFLKAGLKDIKISGMRPWKTLFFWPRWYAKWKWTEKIVYLIGRVLEKIPYPDSFRASFGIQLIGVGTKP